MKYLLLLCVIFVVSAATCKKKQPIDYLPGTWGVALYKEGGVDKTNQFLTTFQAYQLILDAKGNYTIFYMYLGAEIVIKGTWTLENNNTQLTLVDNDPNSKKKIRILTVNTIAENSLTLSEDGKEYYYNRVE